MDSNGSPVSSSPDLLRRRRPNLVQMPHDITPDQLQRELKEGQFSRVKNPMRLSGMSYNRTKLAALHFLCRQQEVSNWIDDIFEERKTNKGGGEGGADQLLQEIKDGVSNV